MSKQPNPHQMRNVAMDILAAVRSANPYPRLVDRGAEPAVVMAVAAALVRAAAGRNDFGAEWVLGQARSGIVDGRQQGTITALEANIGVTVLQLANPHREDERIIYDRAAAWSDTRGLLDSLDVIAAAVDLLHFIVHLDPNPEALLDAMALDIMEPDIETPTDTTQHEEKS